MLESIQHATDLETEILEAEEIQDTIHKYMAVIKSRIEPKCTDTTHTLDASAPIFVLTHSSFIPNPQPAREPVSRLPNLTLPMFSGDPLTWQPFRDSFDSAVHNCPSLSKVQKFNY